MINGRNYDWESTSINLPYGTLIDIEDIEYGDEKETEATYGKGYMPTGYGQGNWKGQGKMTLQREEYDKLIEAFGKEGWTGEKFYDHTPFPITVGYANDDKPTKTDTLKEVKLIKRNFSGKQNDKKLTVPLDFVILGGIEHA